jgi:hypothetical protein
MLAAASSRSARDDTADRAELHQARRLPAQRSTNAAAVPRLTLVTLDCTLFDITKSVAEVVAGVYSPVVLHLRGQPPESHADPGGCRHGRLRGWESTRRPLTERCSAVASLHTS